jgi:hypothetical protein
LKEGTCLRVGLALLIASIGLLALSLFVESGSLFVIADILFGSAHGLCFMAGVATVQKQAPLTERAGALSSFFSIGYAGTIVPILGLGWLADWLGVEASVLGFCGLAMLAATVLLCISSGMRVGRDHSQHD